MSVTAQPAVVAELVNAGDQEDIQIQVDQPFAAGGDNPMVGSDGASETEKGRVPRPLKWLVSCESAAFPTGTYCGLWCMSFFFPFVVIGQLHERIIKRGSCQTLGWGLAFLALLANILSGVFPFVYTIEFAVFVYYVIKIRKAMRERDGIEAGDGPCGNECCSVMWCLPCLLSQMIWHDNVAKDERPGYPFGFCSEMGRNTGPYDGNAPKPYPLMEGEASFVV